MAISRVDFGGRTLMDLTNDTVTSASLLAGYTAHGANGEPILGTASGGSQIMINDLIHDRIVPLSKITVSDVDLTDGVDTLEDGEIYIYVNPT